METWNSDDYKATCLQGDCLEVMAMLPDGCVDMVLTDPPYGTTACKWDAVIPFAPMWEQLRRLCKKNGAIVMTASQPFTSALVMSNVKLFKYDWTWRKPRGTGHLNATKMPMRDKEDIVVFYDEQCTYNPQWGEGEPYTALKGGKVSKESVSAVSGKYMNGAEFRNGSDGRRYPKQVLEFGVVERGTVHPTQKPVALMEYLIRTYTNEGQTVLDFTMGSGTTGVACMNTGREFIGIERDLDDKGGRLGYFEIACKRIAEAHAKNSFKNNLEKC